MSTTPAAPPESEAPAGAAVERVVLSARAERVARERVEAGLPEEVCGLLIGSVVRGEAHVQRVLPCPNSAPPEERHRRFEIDPAIIINVRRTLRASHDSIVGFYHSHPGPDARPSAMDLPHLLDWPRTVWMIIPGASPAQPRAWWLDRSGVDVRELPVSVAPVPAPSLFTCPE